MFEVFSAGMQSGFAVGFGFAHVLVASIFVTVYEIAAHCAK